MSIRRLWWLLRIAFHDWMWEGGHRPDLARRLARALPLHFSDPYVEAWRAHAGESAEWAHISLPTAGPMFTRCGTTSTFGAGTTVTYRYND